MNRLSSVSNKPGALQKIQTRNVHGNTDLCRREKGSGCLTGQLPVYLPACRGVAHEKPRV